MKTENKHTPEPWVVKEDRVIGPLGNTVAECLGYSVMATDADQRRQGGREANANRIVACVNACAGMENPAEDIATLRRERDEAVRILEGLPLHMAESKEYPDAADFVDNSHKFMQAMRDANTLLARLERGSK